MRISTKTYQLMWLNGFNQRQAQVADIQQQLSTGRRISTAADDPAGAATRLGDLSRDAATDSP